MKVSLNWLREFTDITLSTEELVKRIGAQLGEVEEVVDLSERYASAVVVRVVSAEQHPQANKLQVCLIDDGQKTAKIPRDDDGYITVVCGAPNVRAGLRAVWLPPGAVVPSTYEKEQFTLEARAIRGVTSYGMLASGHELAINDDHSGIVEIDKNLEPGSSFAEGYKLNDTIIDIENKMFTHRPDCFGMLGVAREIAGIQKVTFTSPSWYADMLKVQDEADKLLGITVNNQVEDLSPRYMAVAMSNVTVGKSPLILQSYLSRVGIKPVNNVVDVTNFVMMVTGQPIHAFDYDKLIATQGSESNGVEIVIRKPLKNEQFLLLNGKNITPHNDALLIASKKRAVALAGIMGGAETEVDGATKNILLEVGNFNMYSVRKTSMKHGLFTDAATRFTKNQSTLQLPAALNYASVWLKKLTSCQVASKVVDTDSSAGKNTPLPKVGITPQFINQRLGLAMNSQEISRLLTNVEFSVAISAGKLIVTPPFWRTDIHQPEDVVEEVGRLHGYDSIPLSLPKRTILPAAKDPMLRFKKELRQAMIRLGSNELLTYTFVKGDLLKSAHQDDSRAFRLSNAISPELEFYRLSLTPSLINKVHANLKAMSGSTKESHELAIFEINKAHNKHDVDANGLALEYEMLAFVFAASEKTAQMKYGKRAYYHARHYFDQLCALLGLSQAKFDLLADYQKADKKIIDYMAPFEPNRSAIVSINNRVVGVVGEYKTAVKNACKLPDFSAGFELDLLQLQHVVKRQQNYRPIARYPVTLQDITLKVKTTVTYQQLLSAIEAKVRDVSKEHGYQADIEPVEIYQSADDKKHRNITLRITLAHPMRTLRSEEVSGLLSEIADKTHKEFSAIWI